MRICFHVICVSVVYSVRLLLAAVCTLNDLQLFNWGRVIEKPGPSSISTTFPHDGPILPDQWSCFDSGRSRAIYDPPA